ncbi:MFS transporter [Rhodoblastus sp.]|uniref:MFS transporter n=1 Tax=Rhodoblastus sp. TaxID=1962975 RepID=UPI0035AF339E
MTTRDGSRQALFPPQQARRAYAWTLFGLSFGLMMSDHMSRQVLSGVFPLLRQEWGLGDAQLGALSGVVALMVGVLVVPFSIAADLFGRVRSVAAMALLWSFATAACGLAANFDQMLLARIGVGVGEAAYGSVGAAVLLTLFPKEMRATVVGAFLAGAVFGSVIGIALGAKVAALWGWRSAFLLMAAIGVVLALLYLAAARDDRVGAAERRDNSSLAFSAARLKSLGAQLFGVPSVCFAFIASGLQLFVAAAYVTWLPSYLNRAYAMPLAEAGAAAAIFILLSGAGMILCGVAADRASRTDRARKVSCAVLYCLIVFVALGGALSCAPGYGQLALLALGMVFVAGAGGVGGAVVANGVDPAIHATALATLTLANNIFGLAPGPFVTGLLADRYGLAFAMQVAPIASLVAAGLFWLCRGHYARDSAPR